MTSSSTAEMRIAGSILHPTDFSAASNRAFAHALAFALLEEADLSILHAVSKNEADLEWIRYPAVRKTLERWGLLGAGSPQSAVFGELRVRVEKIWVKSRHPASAIAKLIDQKPTDLVVLATEGREGLSRWINRSEAEAIARWVGTMTLFVPAGAKRDLVSLDDGNLSLQNILVPVDWNPDCAAALRLARQAAERIADTKVTITVLHVGPSEIPLGKLEDGPKCTWQLERRQGEPVTEILAAADGHEAGLIVMATAGHDGVLDAFRGSTTEQVLRGAPCPLLAVPASRI